MNMLNKYKQACYSNNNVLVVCEGLAGGFGILLIFCLLLFVSLIYYFNKHKVTKHRITQHKVTKLEIS